MNRDLSLWQGLRQGALLLSLYSKTFAFFCVDHTVIALAFAGCSLVGEDFRG